MIGSVFVLASAVIAKERLPLPPGVPTDIPAIKAELRQLEYSLDVTTLMEGWRASLKMSRERYIGDAYFYLIVLNPRTRRIRVVTFRRVAN